MDGPMRSKEAVGQLSFEEGPSGSPRAVLCSAEGLTYIEVPWMGLDRLYGQISYLRRLRNDRANK